MEFLTQDHLLVFFVSLQKRWLQASSVKREATLIKIEESSMHLLSNIHDLACHINVDFLFIVSIILQAWSDIQFIHDVLYDWLF